MDSLIAFAAQYLFLLVPLGIAMLWRRLPGELRVRYPLQILATAILAVVLAKVGGHFITSPRPFVAGGFTPLIHASADNGFPSDHTLLAATLAMLAFLKDRKLGAGLLLIALVVGVSRVVAGVHSPIDIVGSFAIDIVATAAVSLRLSGGRWRAEAA